MHLRTTADAINAGSSYEKQIRHYLALAKSRGFAVMYVASENEAAVQRMKQDLSTIAPEITVLTQEDLIPEAQLLELFQITAQEAALLDYVVLGRAGYFAGFAESVFTWNVALARTAARAGTEGICGRVRHLWQDGKWALGWRDQWSEVLGVSVNSFRRR